MRDKNGRHIWGSYYDTYEARGDVQWNYISSRNVKY